MLLLAFFCAVAAQPTPPDVATLTLLSDAARDAGAVFLDGSAAAYYLVKGDPSKWIVYQQGGGWCSSFHDCALRANSTLGSSTTYPATSTTVCVPSSPSPSLPSPPKSATPAHPHPRSPLPAA